MRNTPDIRPLTQTVLANDWGTLTKYRYQLRRSDGTWQEQTRETYDRGDGATCLLYNPQMDTVLLTRQFRLPAFVKGHAGHLIEAPAGLLEGADPAERMRAELQEETGFTVSSLRKLFDLIMSPGSITERVTFFSGTYGLADQTGQGGGKHEEGEDIEVLHIKLADALAMASDGRIEDAKTVILLQHLAMEQAGHS